MQLKCVWAVGATNPQTMKSGLPTACKEKGCSGVFDKPPLCEKFVAIEAERQK